jgi:hypothetical protein
MLDFLESSEGMSIPTSCKRHTGRRRDEMKSTRSFATTSLAGTILALMLATGAAPSLSPIGMHVANSYRSAVRTYDRVRRWGVIARWWVDPEYVPVERDVQRRLEPKDLCEMLPAVVRGR